jgi:hypothetical protein
MQTCISAAGPGAALALCHQQCAAVLYLCQVDVSTPSTRMTRLRLMFFWPRQPLNHFYIVNNLCQWWGCRGSLLQEEKHTLMCQVSTLSYKSLQPSSHNTTGSSGNSTPGLELEFADQFAENILRLGLRRWQFLRGHL